ncbi:UvrD-helicase domain-containing protein [Mucilaginibacter terrae]|uniref:DNA 3'-5' helicase n=1 Tax=Mucilaginibacter terrae TaxID=1955052 RepID=A0ABU3GTG6_9SPHI|nr:UvrD-helicase domain-containing protein [Mucilaginibacter terrae]MDT3402262.1 DNA helicase-4 [Mucilaginibacter terrae]
MPNSKIVIKVIRFILLIASVIGIYWLIKEWLLRRAFKKKLSAIIDQVRDANASFTTITNFEQYFCYADELRFLEINTLTRKAIVNNYAALGLDDETVKLLQQFCDNFDNCAVRRKDYNDEFVRHEQVKFGDFFARLEAYPLSSDQTEAIIRDEDNNLVLAGAGTGKTTTISGKVAYLLEKGLARPEELLIISFTNNAAKEMQERTARFCRHIDAAKDLEVRTFNSYGFLVCRSCSNQEIRVAFDDAEQAKQFLQEKFNELFTEDASFKRKAVNYLAFFNRPLKEESDFENRNDYLNYEQGFKNTTLDGKKVKSHQELQIANFFCLFNINYEYERHYPLEIEDRNPAFGIYQPDFYLPDYQIWHEHYGISKNGDVPKSFTTRPPYATAREYYHAGMAWKDSIHEKYNTQLIKSFAHEAAEGKLISNLKHKLAEKGVDMRERSGDELMSLIKQSPDYEDFINFIYVFLTLMKSCGKSPDELSPNRGDKRFRVFLDLIRPLYHAYEHHLNNIPAVDFNDMIIHATQHFKNGAFKKSYKYILIDEFQDMSLGRYELLKAIRSQNPGIKIYAVGDDWQSIFRFTGSDLSIITQFKQHFGVTSQSAVLQTYRFNDQILKVSSEFIQKNSNQIAKQLTAFHSAPLGHSSFEFVKYHNGAKRKQVLVDTLEAIRSEQSNATVFLIGRYKSNAPKELHTLIQQFAGLDIKFYTAHGVKGMTCDYAVLLDLNSGILGFPSEMADDPMLNYLLQEGDNFENAEERRVFYVAITRARYKNFLMYNENQASKFIIELQASGSSNVRCPDCSGPMTKRSGPHSEFYGCLHYPKCKGKIPLNKVGISVNDVQINRSLVG